MEHFGYTFSINVYITPIHAQGFSAHSDHQDVRARREAVLSVAPEAPVRRGAGVRAPAGRPQGVAALPHPGREPGLAIGLAPTLWGWPVWGEEWVFSVIPYIAFSYFTRFWG